MSLISLAFIAQIALFGAAGTMFVRAHLLRLGLDRLDQSLPPSQRYRAFSVRRQAAPITPNVTRERVEILRGVGRFLLYGLVFLVAGAGVSAVILIAGRVS